MSRRLHIPADGKQIHLVVIREGGRIIGRRHRHARFGRNATDPEQVVAGERADRELVVKRTDAGGQRVVDGATQYPSILELILLIAMHRIDQELREVVVDMQLAVFEEGTPSELAVTSGFVKLQ